MAGKKTKYYRAVVRYQGSEEEVTVPVFIASSYEDARMFLEESCPGLGTVVSLSEFNDIKP